MVDFNKVLILWLAIMRENTRDAVKAFREGFYEELKTLLKDIGNADRTLMKNVILAVIP